MHCFQIWDLENVSTFWIFQIYFLYLSFRYWKSAIDFLSIDIHFDVKIKSYHVAYFYHYEYAFNKYNICLGNPYATQPIYRIKD